MKVYAYLAGGLLLAGLLWYEVGVHKKAARVEIAEKALTDYEAAVKARAEEDAKDRAESEKRSTRLALKLADVSAELEDLRKQQPKNTVTYVKVPGEPCPRPRIGDDWFRLWNEAADIASRAVQPAD